MLVAAEPSGDALGAALAARFARAAGPAGPLCRRRRPADGRRWASPARSISASYRCWASSTPCAPIRLVRRRARETGGARRARAAGRGGPDRFLGLQPARRPRHSPRRPASLLIKYVAPQVWATRPGRARTLARAVDRLLTIHAFDAPYFEAAGLPVTFVGNPALGRERGSADPAALRAPHRRRRRRSHPAGRSRQPAAARSSACCRRSRRRRAALRPTGRDLKIVVARRRRRRRSGARAWSPAGPSASTWSQAKRSGWTPCARRPSPWPAAAR